MTQMWNEKGRVVPITIVEAGPCTVARVKSKESDGYEALQIGLPLRRRKVFREVRVEGSSELKAGDVIDVSMFAPGDKVKVTGISKGKGFQGVVKRHHFKGGPASHGHTDWERRPGSIGQRFPQHTFKGKRMAGRMGYDRVTVKNLIVVAVDAKLNVVAIKGAVPGRRGTVLEVKTV
mgnify:CR=1 FL=1